MMKKCVEIDYVRCVLMAIVILVHVVNFGTLHPDFKTSMFTFFMPAFLIITGYLVKKSDIAKLDAGQAVPQANAFWGYGEVKNGKVYDRKVRHL